MIAIPENAHQTPVLRKLDRWSLIVASNDDRTLRNNLLASPVIGDQCQVIAKQGFASAGKAYNAGISEAAHELLVFAHQDVILPPGWTSDLDRALAALAEQILAGESLDWLAWNELPTMNFGDIAIRPASRQFWADLSPSLSKLYRWMRSCSFSAAPPA